MLEGFVNFGSCKLFSSPLTWTVTIEISLAPDAQNSVTRPRIYVITLSKSFDQGSNTNFYLMRV